MLRVGLIVLLGLTAMLTVAAQTVVRTEAQMTAATGDHAPLWLQANRYGLSSLDLTNGYVRAGLFRHMGQDSTRRWAWAAGADVAVAGGFTSTLVVQQAYGELRWLKGLLTIGSKEQPMELKNQELSSGSQTLGVNARPIPSVRLSLPDYWDIPGTRGWLALKGHLSYGIQTDDRWQKDFTLQENKFTEHTRFHTKAGYLRLGREDKPLTLEAGLEMGCQFGGTAYTWINEFDDYGFVEYNSGLKGMWRAFIPGGGEKVEEGTDYENAEGNHLGSWVVRVNYDQPTWGLSLYADHFFEDQSSMFFLDYDGYGTGENWNKKEHTKFFVYDLRDMMVGVEFRLKQSRWADAFVLEYIYTKYQSGPLYHDHTKSMPDHVSGKDDYYNNRVFTGWQHWGQVIGNPLYRSPLYNVDEQITVKNNRFWAWHVGLIGHPVEGLQYRMLCSWQRGFGTYFHPFISPQRNTSVLAEAMYSFSKKSSLKGWSVKGALAFDHGSLLGNNVGAQLTVARQMNLN